MWWQQKVFPGTSIKIHIFILKQRHCFDITDHKPKSVSVGVLQNL